ncbi:MAG: class I SAM-dependent methyltransferase [bacterium]
MAYLFDGKEIAAERLGKLNALFAPATENFLRGRARGKIGAAWDLGCGVGHTTRSLRSAVEADAYIGWDNSEFAIRRARETSENMPEISYRVADIAQPGFTDEPADLIYMRLLLTHLKAPEASLLLWSERLRPGGRILLEETESIATGMPAFRDYIAVVDAMLEANGNFLYIGETLDKMAFGGRLAKEYSATGLVPATARQAAEMFLLNLATWRDTEFIRANYSADVARIERGLTELAGTASKEPAITWSMRRMALTRAL